jgi:hypothetical protein
VRMVVEHTPFITFPRKQNLQDLDPGIDARNTIACVEIDDETQDYTCE